MTDGSDDGAAFDQAELRAQMILCYECRLNGETSRADFGDRVVPMPYGGFRTSSRETWLAKDLPSTLALLVLLGEGVEACRQTCHLLLVHPQCSVFSRVYEGVKPTESNPLFQIGATRKNRNWGKKGQR